VRVGATAAARSGRPTPSRGPATPHAAPRAAASEGPQIQLIPAPADGALDAADEAVDLLLDTGRSPGEILVLTTGDPHPWAAHELSFGEASYWAQHDAADDVFYASLDAERAAGRPVVVLALNGGTEAEAAAALPSALGRAGRLLVVCGDPARINGLPGAGA
jgi:hypothetical protein